MLKRACAMYLGCVLLGAAAGCRSGPGHCECGCQSAAQEEQSAALWSPGPAEATYIPPGPALVTAGRVLPAASAAQHTPPLMPAWVAATTEATAELTPAPLETESPAPAAAIEAAQEAAVAARLQSLEATLESCRVEWQTVAEGLRTTESEQQRLAVAVDAARDELQRLEQHLRDLHAADLAALDELSRALECALGVGGPTSPPQTPPDQNRVSESDSSVPPESRTTP